MTGTGARAVALTTLTTSDTFVYLPAQGQILTLRNATVGALTPTIDGADGTTVPVAGIGLVNVAPGLVLASIAAGTAVAIPLDSVSAYLQGVITVTGGLGIVATLTSN